MQRVGNTLLLSLSPHLASATSLAAAWSAATWGWFFGRTGVSWQWLDLVRDWLRCTLSVVYARAWLTEAINFHFQIDQWPCDPEDS